MNFATNASRWKMCFYRPSVSDNVGFSVAFSQDTHASHAQSVLVKRRPFYYICFQIVVYLWYQLPRQSLDIISCCNFESRSLETDLEDSRGWDAMRQQIIQLCADLQDPRRRVLGHYLIGDLSNKGFPVSGRQGRLVCDFLALL